MKVIYDPEQDTVRILFRSAPIAHSTAREGGLIMDYADDGSLVGLEMTEASRRIHAPDAVEFCPASASASACTE
jgi:uncharacterized protein YuzE